MDVILQNHTLYDEAVIAPGHTSKNFKKEQDLIMILLPNSALLPGFNPCK